MADFTPWPKGMVATVRSVRSFLNKKGDARTSIDIIAGVFGFQRAVENDWDEFRRWCHGENMDFTLAQGPYVMTILKAMAAKRGRVGVSTLSSE